MHSDIARKLCVKLLQVLEDTSLDILPSEPLPTPESPFDYEGVDLLAETVLVGISSWCRVINAATWVLQPWYTVFREVVHLLRRPLSAALLPSSFACATSDSLEKDIPTTYREVEFDIMVKTSTKVSSTSRVPGLYYSEDTEASGEEPKPRDSAAPENTAPLSIPPSMMINWDVSDRSDQSSPQSDVAQSSPQFNIVVLGDPYTGKSALAQRFIRDIYMESYDPTIEENYYRQIMVDGQLSSLSVLDTAGAELFTSLNEADIKSGRGFVLVFSLARESGLLQVDRLRNQIYRVKGSRAVPIVVAATQSDRASEREVPAHTLESLSSEWNIPFYETSAKRNWRVDDVFEGLVRQMRRRYPPVAARKQKKQTQGPCIIM
ncbi:P-loop containing nucleoside triphosphate hydrolase protein [Mycena sanguinolenta]|nr:P-loop containing nucleoside triphosphate hydrolase protein [Mycena sanguinolenta]